MQLGMSQDDLAQLLGVTFQQVQKYEKGLNRIGASRLFHLGEALGVPIQFFFDDLSEGARKSAPGAEAAPMSITDTAMIEFLYSREGIELSRAFLSITDPHVRRTLLCHIQALADGSINP